VSNDRAAAPAEFLDPPGEPLALLERWLEEAASAGEIDPTAAVVATVDEHGQPSTRCIGVQGCDARGLLFFVNLDTRKGRDLLANPKAAATLYWPAHLRQVNVAGRVEFTSVEESDQLWRDRGRPGQIASSVSHQGQPVEDRDSLPAHASDLAGVASLSRPGGHVGMVLVPATIEFWSGRTDRLHDRLHYGRTTTGWEHWLLQP
jgi:pyridoxamine-phosphate oxidase